VAPPGSAPEAARASSPDASDLEVTVADPVNDLLATTEMPTVREGFAAPEEQAAEEEEPDPNKAYFAPQAIPTPAVPDNDDSRRIVLNLPDQAAVLPPSPQDVDRARRRAPTVKIPRATLAARGALPGAAPAPGAAPEVALPPPPPPAPRAPVLATPAEDPPEAMPPSPPLSLPVRAEPPPTARHVSEPPQRTRSRMPLVALAALCIGGGVFAVFSLGGGSREATKVSDASGPPTKPASEKAPAAAPPATTTPEKPAIVTPPEETAAPPITLSADPPPPATQTTMAGATPPKPAPPTVAGSPPTPPRPAAPASFPAAPAATPRPPAAAPPKPPSKPGDYTPPTI
jgi:hypothetical protein